MTALILIASALTSVVYVPSVAQMYVWRLLDRGALRRYTRRA